jgi:hypothetical protein
LYCRLEAVFLCLLRRAAGNALGLTRLRQYSFARPGAKAQLKIRPSPVKGDNLLCALQVPHPQRPVTRARDGARALDDQLLLHGKARHDMKEEPANRCLRVDAIGHGLKMDMLVFHLINQI